MTKTNKFQDAVMDARIKLEAAKTLDLIIGEAALKMGTFRNEETGERITDPKADYMMSDESFSIYLRFCTALFYENGIVKEIEASYVYPFEQALQKAEDELIKYGLGIMPKRHIKEKEILENACFGLNGYCKQFNIRKEFIEQTLKLDVSTVIA